MLNITRGKYRSLAGVQASSVMPRANTKITIPKAIFPSRRKANTDPITWAVMLTGRNNSWSNSPRRTRRPKSLGSNPPKNISIVPKEISTRPYMNATSPNVQPFMCWKRSNTRAMEPNSKKTINAVDIKSSRNGTRYCNWLRNCMPSKRR